jgi:hypothetical protein
MEYIACQGKLGHNTFADAKKHISKPYKGGQHDKLAKQQLDVYKCLDCGKWHAGKTTRATHVRARAQPYRRYKLRYDV